MKHSTYGQQGLIAGHGPSVARYAELLVEGCAEAGVGAWSRSPARSKLAQNLPACAPTARSIRAGTNEAEMPGNRRRAPISAACARLMVMENSGFAAGLEAIVRFAYCHHMPMVR